MPSIFAPSEMRKRQRSCTCGSLAAFEIIVAPGRERRCHDGVLGRHHRRLVEVDVRALQPSAQLVAPVQIVDAAPSSANAWMCGSSRRRPITSPPGGGTLARPRRASSGPASRNDARIRLASCVVRARARSPAHGCAPRSGRSTRRRRRGSRAGPIIVSTSRMRGRFVSSTGSSVSRHAARIGSAPFLLPDARMRPESGCPPSITNDSAAGLTMVEDTKRTMLTPPCRPATRPGKR